MKHWIELHIYNSENRIMFNLNNIVDIVESNSGGGHILLLWKVMQTLECKSLMKKLKK